MRAFCLLLLIILMLSGCASQKEFVQVPISMPCKTEIPSAPSYRFSPPYSDVFEGTRDLLGDRALSLGYEQQLRAALESCK